MCFNVKICILENNVRNQKKQKQIHIMLKTDTKKERNNRQRNRKNKKIIIKRRKKNVHTCSRKNAEHFTRKDGKWHWFICPSLRASSPRPSLCLISIFTNFVTCRDITFPFQFSCFFRAIFVDSHNLFSFHVRVDNLYLSLYERTVCIIKNYLASQWTILVRKGSLIHWYSSFDSVLEILQQKCEQWSCL